MEQTIRAGDRLLLLGPDGERHVLVVEPETKRVPGLGVLKLADLIGKPWGSRLKLGPHEYLLERPLLDDHVRLLERKAQIVLPKDAARIVYEAGLHAGSRVAEAGVGSGALTLVLAHAVAPSGRVFAYDVRSDHLNVGRRNLERAGLADVVEFRVGDIVRDLHEADLDAFVLDLPEPEAAVEAAAKALRPGGVFVAFSPLVVQVERTHRALALAGFTQVRTIETLERAWVVHERGSRPETTMLAHTGFLTVARRP